MSTPNKQVVYLASGWFSPDQDEQLTRLEKVFDDRSSYIDLRSPRRIFVCKPDASQEVQEDVFRGNVRHIEEADIVLVNTSYRDIGTIFEAGVAFQAGRPIIYFCENLPAGSKFNLMLARSGVKVCTTIEQLTDYIDRCNENGSLIVEMYDKEIE
jgi:nucleoside 2-deoxyribosyltransferase